MTTWVFKTRERKNVLEIEIWQINKQEIIRTTDFRWGKVYYKSIKKPKIDLANHKGFSVLDSGYNFEYDILSDIFYCEVKCPKNMNKNVIKILETSWIELANEGWEKKVGCLIIQTLFSQVH